MKIGFIGLGNMGAGMAANLVRANYEVSAFDLSPEAQEKARQNGCTISASAAQACTRAQVVVSMLPNGKIVEEVYTRGVIGNASDGALFIDCSTIDVATARKVIERAKEAGHEMVDAPVSGGIAAANSGSLTFMVGGTLQAFERAKPVLEAMGKAVIHAGDAGNGQAAKICNNMLLAVHMIGTCEAFTMAAELGLDPQTFYDIASVSSGQCWSMTSYCPVAGVGPESPSDNDFQGGFATELMLKDLRLAMEAAGSVAISPALGRRAMEIYEAHADKGNEKRDFSSIIASLTS